MDRAIIKHISTKLNAANLRAFLKWFCILVFMKLIVKSNSLSSTVSLTYQFLARAMMLQPNHIPRLIQRLPCTYTQKNERQHFSISSHSNLLPDLLDLNLRHCRTSSTQIRSPGLGVLCIVIRNSRLDGIFRQHRAMHYNHPSSVFIQDHINVLVELLTFNRR